MKARLFLVISIAATMLWSCQFDDVLSTPSNEGVIRVTSSLTKAESTGGTTESTTNDNFKDNEIIYVWADKNGTNDGYIKAWKLTANDDKGHFNGDSKAWPYDGKDLDFHALHGNFDVNDLNDKKWSDLTSLKHTVHQDQSTDENRRQSDLLYAAKTEAKHGNNVELSFEHLLAKITVKLDLKNSMGISIEDFENASVSILRIQPEAYFKSSSKDASTSGGTEIEINAGTIDKPSELTSEANYAGSAIVPLQTIAAEQQLIKIKLKDRTFIYKASETTTFQKGQEYTYTLTIRGKQITGSLSVSDFTPDEDKNITFEDKFDYLADLKNRSYLGSADNPHDLSYDYNGQMNTANCYVVTHPGYYKLPLVYGNAIKNGATNDIAYGSTTFVNHLGKKITDPYIYKNLNNNNVELEAHSAALVWQDAESLINNIGLSSDKHYIQFEITKENIEQGNAVIAVKDEGGKIMWSWHIWVTNKNVYKTYTYGDYKFMPIALGERETDQGTTCTFYQWGRKDPFKGATANGQAPDNMEAQSSYNSSITNPGKFILGTSGYNYNWFNGNLLDLWNVGNTTNESTTSTSKKTIYDPSPVGFKVPPPAAFTDIGLSNNDWSPISGNEGIKVPATGDFWRAFGNLDWTTGFSARFGTHGYYWSCGPYVILPYLSGWSLFFHSGDVISNFHDVRSNGWAVRPVSE